MPIYKMDGKKDGLQKYRVRINYIDKTGKSRQLDRVAYGAQAAKELERQLIKDQTHEVDNRLTLRDVYYLYITAQKSEVRESTIDKTKSLLEKFVLADLGDIKVKRLNTQILQKWKNDLSEMTKSNGEPFSLKYKRNIYGELSALLNFAVKMEYIEKSPLKVIGNFKDPNAVKKEMDYYTPVEFKSFISVAKTQAEAEEKHGNIGEWNYYVFFMIAFYTGMRKGEIYALKWSDMSGDMIKIRRSISQKLGDGDRETPPKNTSSVRDIQIPLPLKKALNDHYARCRAIEGFSDDWRICGGYKCIRDSTLNNRNRAYADLAQVKHIRIHDFRHSHASVLINERINIMEIARRLGHSNAEITWSVYAHLYPRESERATEVLNKIV